MTIHSLNPMIMKMTRILLMLALLNGFISGQLPAQEPERPGQVPADPAVPIPPLSVLIDSAIAHNPMVRFRDLGIIGKESNLSYYRSYWTRNLGIQGDVRYGTFNNFSTNTAEGQVPSTIATSTNQVVYGLGAYMKFPVQDIVNRRSQIKMAKSEMDQAVSMAEAQRDELRQTVIKQYNDLLLKQRLLLIKSKNFGDARMNKEMVEKEFQNGVIPVSEYVRISDIIARVESDYESAKTDFITAYMVLEDIAGYKFQQTGKK